MSSKMRLLFVLTDHRARSQPGGERGDLPDAMLPPRRDPAKIRVGRWESGDALEPCDNAIAAFEEKPILTSRLNFEPVPQDYGDQAAGAIWRPGPRRTCIQVGDGDVAKFVGRALSSRSIPSSRATASIWTTTFFPAWRAFGQIGWRNLPADQRLQPAGAVLQQRHVR